MSDNVVFRITFNPDSASDFLLDEQVATGQYVVERDDYTLEEAYDFCAEFYSCLDDAQILVNGQRVVTLSDFLEAQ